MMLKIYHYEILGKFNRWDQLIFLNLYIRLQFASIGRTDNISRINFSLVGWDEDALTLLFTSTKADQEGERTNERKHIYASNYLPHVCVILCLAIYVWCKPLSEHDYAEGLSSARGRGRSLFGNKTSQKSRFSRNIQGKRM